MLSAVSNPESLIDELKVQIKQQPWRFFRVGTWELGDSLALEHETEQAKRLVLAFRAIPNAILRRLVSAPTWQVVRLQALPISQKQSNARVLTTTPRPVLRMDAPLMIPVDSVTRRAFNIKMKTIVLRMDAFSTGSIVHRFALVFASQNGQQLEHFFKSFLKTSIL